MRRTCTAIVLTACTTARATADITAGFQDVHVNLTRAWYNASGALVGSTNFSTLAGQYPPNSPPTLTPQISDPYPSLVGPGGATFTGSAFGAALLSGVSTQEYLSVTSQGDLGVIAAPPPFGQAQVTGEVTHTIEFTLDAPTAWTASVWMDPESPFLRVGIYQAFGIAGQTNVFSQMFSPGGPGQSVIGGTLAVGSYSFEAVYTTGEEAIPAGGSPLSFQISAGVTFQILAPSPIAVVPAVGAVMLSLRRRR